MTHHSIGTICTYRFHPYRKALGNLVNKTQLPAPVNSETVDISRKTLDDTRDMTGDLTHSLAGGGQSASTDLINADPLTSYLSRLSYIEPLDPDQQQELAERYKENADVNAGRMLIVTNLRLVVKIAREYQRRWTNLLDLIQEGNVGLSEAVTRYDPYRGVKFTSYAQYWIRAMILNYLMNQLHPVKLGSSRAGRKLFYNLKKARRELQRLGKEPTPALVAEYLDVDESDVVRISAQLDGPPVFLDAPVKGFENNETTVGELMADPCDLPDKIAADRQINSEIYQAVHEFGDQLTKERDRSIWFDRMISDDPKSLVQLGEEWGVSKERIRQVEVRIRNRFKEFLIEHVGEDARIEFLENM